MKKLSFLQEKLNKLSAIYFVHNADQSADSGEVGSGPARFMTGSVRLWFKAARCEFGSVLGRFGSGQFP